MQSQTCRYIQLGLLQTQGSQTEEPGDKHVAKAAQFYNPHFETSLEFVPVIMGSTSPLNRNPRASKVGLEYRQISLSLPFK